MDNFLKLQIPALGRNEAFARNALAAFVLDLSPTVEEINDLKTAVSEAVTNSVVHAYKGGDGLIEIAAEIDENCVYVTINDFGCGIDDIEKAKTPFFTTAAEAERSGMGFTIMETFMDDLKIESTVGQGTSVTMMKTFGGKC